MPIATGDISTGQYEMIRNATLLTIAPLLPTIEVLVQIILQKVAALRLRITQLRT